MKEEEIKIVAVPVRPSPRLFDAGDDPGFFVSFYLPHPQTFSNKSLLLSEEKRIFAKKDHLQMRVGSNRCPYLKFMAHVPLF